MTRSSVVVILLFGIIFTLTGQVSAQIALCGGSGGSSFILPSTSNVDVLILYAYFPDEGFTGTEDIPTYANTVAEHDEDYYEEMSYGIHHLNIEVFDPNNGDAFEADHEVSYYRGGATSSGVTELNTEILDKAYAED